MMTAKEIAEYLRIHIMTFYRIKKELPVFKVGSRYRTTIELLDKYMAQKTK